MKRSSQSGPATSRTSKTRPPASASQSSRPVATRSHTPHSERARHEEALRQAPHGALPREASRRAAASEDDAKGGDRLARGDRRLPHTSSPRRKPPAKKPPKADAPMESGATRLQASRHRRARQRVRATSWAYLIPTVIFSLVLMAMTSVVMGDRRRFGQEVEAAEAQLKALEMQLATGQRRVETLQSPKGREQLLVEHGYLKPGDRILLFPPTKDEQRSAPEAKNDLAPRRAAITGQDGGSPWRRAADAVSRWIENWSGSKTR